jgi:hypothetical protein
MASASIIDDTGTHDVLEVVALDGNKLRVRSPYLFEVGEELRIRIDDAGASREVTALVRMHDADHVSELELT